MRVALVVNTQSGGTTDPRQIVALLVRGGAHVQTILFAELNGAGSLPAGTDRLVIAGGDGSIGVAADAARAAGIPLAVVPTGTANDFVRAQGIPEDLEQACALAADPATATRRCELGRVGAHPFVNTAAAGLSTVANRLAEQHKPQLGPLAYVVGALEAGLTAPTLPCRVRCDGQERFAGDVWQVVVGVTGAFGGGSGIGGTRPDDGRLDAAVVPAGSRVGLARRAYAMRRGRLTAQRDVNHYRARVIEVDLPPGTPFNIDGDVRECDPARFELVTGGVQIVVP
ncbi:MAG: hypothetical protein M3308_11555 [Actinomycetota bacterium]|nr:hypothetical protein [Actinomycetota bacterium]